MDTSSWLWVGTIGMALGSLVLAYLGFNLRKEDRHHAALAVGITLVAATAYYAMVHNFGDLMVSGTTVQSARYIDWLVTTPMLLLSLGLVGLPSKVKNRGWTMATLVFLDVYMIVTGFLATLVDSSTKWVWFSLSTLALLLIAYILYVVIMKEVKASANPKLGKLYVMLASYLSVLWLFYPLVWYLGGNGQNKLDFKSENMLYAVLDLLAKVGFGILLVWGVRNLAKSSNPKAGESTVESLEK